MITFVLGGADCVWHDLARARYICQPDAIICVNHVGIEYPGAFDAWCSFHGSLLESWRREREKAGRPPAKEMWVATTSDRYKQFSGYRMRTCGGGSSGMFGTDVALDRGADKVILCGIPMTPTPHFHDRQHGKPWTEAEKHRAFWIKRAGYFQQAGVRSMSGWTRELLGAP